MDFILALIRNKIKDGRLDCVITALNFLGAADTTITITGFTSRHADVAFSRTKLFMYQPIHAWELCAVNGITFADEFRCSFIGGPPKGMKVFRGNLLTLLVDRILRATLVEDRDILKGVFKIFDNSTQRAIIEV